MINVFLAHAKGDSQHTVQRAIDLLRQHSAAECNITLGFDEWSRSFRKCGNYEAWAAYVATAKAYGSNTPLFDVFVCIDETIGRATETIVQAALRAGKPVCLVESAGIRPVVDTRSLGEDYQRSAALVLQ